MRLRPASASRSSTQASRRAPTLTGRITGFFDFTNGQNGAAVAPYDDYGHGTHVAGLVGSSGILSNYEFQGIAPSVHFVGLKVLDGTGAGSTSDVIAALQYVTANKADLNIHIVNMSLGHPIYAPAADDPLVQAVQEATAAGLIVVTSAGNIGRNEVTGLPGYAGITSPCNAPSAICVGAANTKNTVTRDDDVVAPYSSRGPSWYDGAVKPDVIAPGHKLKSDTDVTSYLYTHLLTSQAEASNGHAAAVAERHEHGRRRGQRRGGARSRRAQSQWPRSTGTADGQPGQGDSPVLRHPAVGRRLSDTGRRRDQRGGRHRARRCD